MESYLLVRLPKQDKSDLFLFAKEHCTTASEVVRQLIRGSVKPNAPRLISSHVIGDQNGVVSPVSLP